MKIFTAADKMSSFSVSIKGNGQSIGFVPTMGALHQGHISLVEEAKRVCDVVIVSVFVNPTQFNNPDDLAKYPRTFETDRTMLEKAGVDAVFYPSVDEVYPLHETKHYDLDGLDELMEGPNRPGHFNGVVQVVTRFFDIVSPDIAFFGEKDFQQLAIIRHMTKKLNYSIEVIGCPTVREQSGLAMSSRNMRLSEHGKEIATVLVKALREMKNLADSGADEHEIRLQGMRTIQSEDEIELEYLELVDPQSLKHATNGSTSIRACIAAYVEGVRLIDNMQVK